jgi:1,4-dihydroxy-2-naphthoyl-CoA hydrolase
MSSDAGEKAIHHPEGPAQSGFNKELGLTFISASGDEVIAEIEIGEGHLQPMGIVHGGVYAALAETVCSVGAYLAVAPFGLLVVGVDNHTSFLRATRSGKLRVTGKPITRGRRTQLWEASILNDRGDLAATGRVRLLCIEPGSSLAGETAGVRTKD